ncbi:hypothetical protein TrST_g10515 [Triparma strigata]|uniref:WW domain-containing protein n=1 Tax=Triparma strigata TaxID=1606541 RepID=A0A9W7DTH9_9STRA|nr:hypothetical protein TrST_g10515 [Triparma strigata]
MSHSSSYPARQTVEATINSVAHKLSLSDIAQLINHITNLHSSEGEWIEHVDSRAGPTRWDRRVSREATWYDPRGRLDPNEWEEGVDGRSGKRFWHSRANRTTSFDDLKAGMPGWVQRVEEESKAAYWQNEGTGKTSWDLLEVQIKREEERKAAAEEELQKLKTEALERKKLEECPKCGQHCFSIPGVFSLSAKRMPLNIEDKVDNGRCLICNPGSDADKARRAVAKADRLAEAALQRAQEAARQAEIHMKAAAEATEEAKEAEVKMISSEKSAAEEKEKEETNIRQAQEAEIEAEKNKFEKAAETAATQWKHFMKIRELAKEEKEAAEHRKESEEEKVNTARKFEKEHRSEADKQYKEASRRVRDMKNRLIAYLPAPSCGGVWQLCSGGGPCQVCSKNVPDGGVGMQCSNGGHFLCWYNCILVTGCNAANIEAAHRENIQQDIRKYTKRSGCSCNPCRANEDDNKAWIGYCVSTPSNQRRSSGLKQGLDLSSVQVCVEI